MEVCSVLNPKESDMELLVQESSHSIIAHLASLPNDLMPGPCQETTWEELVLWLNGMAEKYQVTRNQPQLGEIILDFINGSGVIVHRLEIAYELYDQDELLDKLSARCGAAAA
jgi:hypothetical protein